LDEGVRVLSRSNKAKLGISSIEPENTTFKPFLHPYALYKKFRRLRLRWANPIDNLEYISLLDLMAVHTNSWQRVLIHPAFSYLYKKIERMYSSDVWIW